MSHSYDPSSKHARLTKSKATETTTAIQPLEITTTAVVTGSGHNPSDGGGFSNKPDERKPTLISNKSHLHTPSGNNTTCLSTSSSSDVTNTLKQSSDNNQHDNNNNTSLPPTLEKKPTFNNNSSNSNDTPESTDMHRKKSRHHHHHHFIKSPVFQHGDPLTSSVVSENVVSPLISPMALATLSATVTTLDTVFPALPPPIDGPSEAVVALYDAANESVKSKSPRSATDTMTQLFDSCFFSAILLVQWSNVVGPKVSKAWSGEPMDTQLLTTIARQVLNGEMGRTLSDIEPKWLVLHRQGLICTAFLFQDPCSKSLCALVMVVPVRYLRNFSQYFKVLSQRVPRQLIDVLIKLRKVYRRLNTSWSVALDYFANIHLFPLIQSIMDLESVSLPTEWPKITHTLLAKDTKPVVDVDFLVQMITSHLQTYGSTLLIGKSLTSVNILINILALFLSPEERSRSSHARKHHKYMPDLYLQGLLLQVSR
ncbi:C9orf72-like protein family-domain-containing protein [Chlamydoabsidia padenii]|nr:C9orf72-like protein family-domain-containing protein [Chlamydoabsidia padenii]